MADTATHTTASLVRQAVQQGSTLIRDEVRLAKLELAGKARSAGSGVGLLAGAGMCAFFAVAALLMAAGLGLANVMPAWAAALVVAGGLIVLVAILALTGRALLRRATPPAPEHAVASIRADFDAVGAAIGDGRR